MTSQKCSLLDVLFSDREEAGDHVHDVFGRMSPPSAVRRLAPDTSASVIGQLAALVTDMLDLDLGGVAQRGWRKHRAIMSAMERTSDAPNSREIVELWNQRLTSVHRPALDIFVDGVQVHTMRFDIEIVIDVKVMSALVRAGSLVGLRAGDCVVRGTLNGYGFEMSRERRIDLGFTMEARRHQPQRALNAPRAH